MNAEDIRWQQRFDNFRRALNVLNRVAPPAKIENETHVLASIQAFEMTLELAWNLLKDYMQAEGLQFQLSPKSTIREALNKNYITDGQVWMDAIKDRNLTAHSYNQEIAKQLITDIQKKFLPMFVELEQSFIDFLATA
jgi:nucleotidyltransferase substrate binding protein (TIGR01987 family)